MRCGRGKVHTGLWWGSLREWDHLEDEKNIKMYLQRVGWWYALDWSDSGKGQVVGSCKGSSELPVFPQMRRISWLLENLLASLETLYSMHNKTTVRRSATSKLWLKRYGWRCVTPSATEDGIVCACIALIGKRNHRWKCYLKTLIFLLCMNHRLISVYSMLLSYLWSLPVM